MTEPHMNPRDKKLFIKHLQSATHYFEWGSGGSTVLTAKFPNIKSLTSIESDKSWIQTVEKQVLGKPHVKLVFVDIHCTPNDWGRPGPLCTEEQHKSYSEQIVKYTSPESLDLILIDGRYRVACCLKSFSLIRDTCVVLFDDFLNRPHYHVVLAYYDIIDKTADNCMAVLQKKKDCLPPSDELIAKYELDPN